jgi:hypothetical protein
LNQPAINQRTATTTAFFDINSGKISTHIVSNNGNCYFNGNGNTTEKFLSSKTIELQSPTVVAHANKKPSYLNLACCVNGYSNYTNYDSVERKEINKSREVSPIRPIIAMARQQRSSENLLSVPAPVTFIKQSPLTSITKRFASLNIHDINDKDTTDNAGVIVNGNGNVANRKSFIQQRVEKLYGTTKILTTTTTMSTTSSTTTQMNGNGHSISAMNGSEIDEKENDEEFYNSLPVMKHLRPEFARQLKFLNSPKKMPRTSAGSTVIKSDKIESKCDSTEIITAPPSKIEVNLEKQDIVMERISKAPANAESQQNGLTNNNTIELGANVKNNNMINNNNCIDKKVDEIETKDGHYFLDLLKTEKARILKLAEDAEKELEVLQSDVNII